MIEGARRGSWGIAIAQSAHGSPCGHPRGRPFVQQNEAGCLVSVKSGDVKI